MYISFQNQMNNSVNIYTVSHKKWSQLIFVCNFVKNQRILMQFSLLELTMNCTCEGVNFTHITQLIWLHYHVKVETVKM